MSDRIKKIINVIFRELDLGVTLIKYGLWLGSGMYLGFTIMIHFHNFMYIN